MHPAKGERKVRGNPQVPTLTLSLKGEGFLDEYHLTARKRQRARVRAASRACQPLEEPRRFGPYPRRQMAGSRSPGIGDDHAAEPLVFVALIVDDRTVLRITQHALVLTDR